MDSDTAIAPSSSTEIGDQSWRWSTSENDDRRSWHLRWTASSDLRRHLRFSEDIGQSFFPYSTVSQDAKTLEIEASSAILFSRIQRTELSEPVVVGLFESLGQILRQLHDLPSPSGFGDPGTDGLFHTYNAFMAAEFTTLGRQMQSVENNTVRDTAVETLALLRNELSGFHPHGKSTWTVGRLSPERIAVNTKPLRVESFLDFGAVMLRPPEYDLAALFTGNIFEDLPLAQRAFWKGYQAAVTCDLRRRISYFERLIELERLLGCPAFCGVPKSQ